MSYYPPQPASASPAGRRRSSGLQVRLIIGAAILLFSIISYLSTAQRNPVTGENQHVAISEQDEIAMGLQATPQMVRQYGGLSRDLGATRIVDGMGARLVQGLRQRLAKEGIELPYPFDFHLLADDRTINAFALPGGQVFITEALFRRLTHEAQLAGILGHEMGHVIERHGAQRMANGRMWQGIAGAAGVVGGDANSARMAAMIGNLVNMKYGRGDELESDRWGVEIMALAGYDPRHMIEVMDILDEASAGGGPPEFLSTHPKPANRKRYIQQVIDERFPNGVPAGLK